jgi:hypothetical protein
MGMIGMMEVTGVMEVMEVSADTVWAPRPLVAVVHRVASLSGYPFTSIISITPVTSIKRR